MLLHRHSSAGEKRDSPIDDRARPLDPVGRADARRLPWLLAGYSLEGIVSSPYRRCLESVEPLAVARSLEVEPADELAPDAALDDVKALLERLDDATLACTHREVLDRLFDGRLACEKGGTWMVERRGSLLVPVEYVPPPAVRDRQPASHGTLARSG